MARRLFAPDVVQASAMDCGPASLKCLLEGFGIPISYGRLREACQIELDGTSIDVLEDVAGNLGLDAEQVILPVDHIALPEARALPGIVVVQNAAGATHFVVAWRSHGRLAQVMDPATGRRWTSWSRFLEQVYVHSMVLPARRVLDWAKGPEGVGCLRSRLENVGVKSTRAEQLIADAHGDPCWRSFAALDAAARMARVVSGSGGITRRDASALLEAVYLKARLATNTYERLIPARFRWMDPAGSDDSGQLLRLSGAVVVRVLGRREVSPSEVAGRSYELKAAVREHSAPPARTVLQWLQADGVLAPLTLGALLTLSAAGVCLEALMFRSLLDLRRSLTLSAQALGAVLALVTFLLLTMLIDAHAVRAALRFGRGLELRLRMALAAKIPRLNDRYFASRLVSDMAQRSHDLQHIRTLPDLGCELGRTVLQLVFTSVGIAVVDHRLAWLVGCVAAANLAVPLLAQPVLTERDLRVRDHTGALSRFYFDALMGAIPIRCHGAEESIARTHESRLSEWARASNRFVRLGVITDVIHGVVGFGGAAALVLLHLSGGDVTGGTLLIAYWSVMLPVVGQQIGAFVHQYPICRNVTSRALEPLAAPEHEGSDFRASSTVAGALPTATTAASISLGRVTVKAGGHVILRDFDLRLRAREHVAVVGPSGAGKSSLAGVLLGFYPPSSGFVLVDGETLEGSALERLRAATAWVDPAVQLWNRSLHDNLCYGAGTDAYASAAILETAELVELLEQLPDGLQTMLGEGGALISGGGGQRVRLGRALQKRTARLVILDEPFRGLDRATRSRLLERVRRWWQGATMLFMTHDLRETLDFSRVIVLDGGRVVEDGTPHDLLSSTNSRYRAIFEAEAQTSAEVSRNDLWRQVALRHGRLEDRPGV